MEFKTSPAEKSQLELTVSLTELDMEKYYQRALDSLSKEIKIKGFRPGKVPASVIEQQLDQNQIHARAAEMALAPTYSDIVTKEKIEPIGRPSVKIENLWPLKFTALIPLQPKITFEKLEEIKVEKVEKPVTEEDVNNEITRFQKAHATYMPLDRAVQKGDRVEIDFDGYDESKVPLENTSSRNHPMILGEGNMVPGFEDQIIGMQVGEKREITVTFPANYFHTPFQNKKVNFIIRLIKAEESQIPAIDADFILKIAGEAMSVEDFKAKVKQSLEFSRREESEKQLESSFLNQVLAKVKMEIPDSLLEEETDYILDEMQADMKNRGVDWKQYLDAVQKDESQIRLDQKKEAEKRLSVRFAVLELFKINQIEADQKELDLAFDEEMKLLSEMQVSPQQINPQTLRFRLENRIKMDKLIKKFLQS